MAKTMILAPGQWKIFEGVKVENTTNGMLRVTVIVNATK